MLPPGTTLDDKYEIEAVIGQGGFGYVYRARERLTGETVAIKELVPGFFGDAQMVQRFIQEARATLRLTHRHIVRTYGIFQDHGTYYLAMEHLPGGSLADKLEDGPLRVEEAVRIAGELCDALVYAHQEGVVHCDIKPANVLFDARGRVRLADFGIAHVSTQLMTRQLFTTDGTAMGTVRYMAPEQLEGVRDDPRIDIYALGALLYEMLAGRPYLDFETESTPAAQVRNVQRIRSASPPPLEDVNPKVPRPVARAVQQALDKVPSSRPKSVRAFRQALGRTTEYPPAMERRSLSSEPAAPVEAFQESSLPPQEPRGDHRVTVPRWVAWGLAGLTGLIALAIVALLIIQVAPRLRAGINGPSPPTTAASRSTEVPDDQAGQPPSVGADALGGEENPIVWSFVPSGLTEQVTVGAQEVADLLHDETGLYFETNVATEYAGVIEAMCSDPPEAHMGSLNTFAYVLANEGCGVEAALVAVRFGSPTYNGQLITRADSGIGSIADLEGKTFCRPDPLSTSGWIIPSLSMRAEGINPEQDLAAIVDTGTHDAVVAAVYNGDCEAGATYVDARSTLEDEEPDVMAKVVVFHITVDTPNDGVQFIPGMDEELKDHIVEALLTISETEEGREALDTAYDWAGLQKHGDAFYGPFRQVLQASGKSIEGLQE
jgi:phosphate/phosphite/phosphonate ABC transporter binding protein